MTVSKPYLNLDDLTVKAIEIVPGVASEDLTQGHAAPELGASCEWYTGSCYCRVESATESDAPELI